MTSIPYHSYKTTYERGDIWYVEKYQSEGSEMTAGRPAIIVSNDKNNRHAPVVEVVYLTTQPKSDLPTHVSITSSSKESTALCEQITTVAKTRLVDFSCKCTEAEMKEIDKAMAISLGLALPEDTVVEKPVKVKQNSDTELTKVMTERDTYKELYHQLLKAIVEK